MAAVRVAKGRDLWRGLAGTRGHLMWRLQGEAGASRGQQFEGCIRSAHADTDAVTLARAAELRPWRARARSKQCVHYRGYNVRQSAARVSSCLAAAGARLIGADPPLGMLRRRAKYVLNSIACMIPTSHGPGRLKWAKNATFCILTRSHASGFRGGEVEWARKVAR